MPASNDLRSRKAGMQRILPLLLGLMLLLIPAIAGVSLRSAQAFTNGQAASVVVGQVNFGSVSQYRANEPANIAFDSAGNLWVADYVDSRVLRFSPPFSNGMGANLAIGQSDLVSSTSATSQTGLYGPVSLTFDSSGNLWVVDHLNNRLLRYSPPFSTGMAANLVLGQSFYTTSLGQGTTSANSLYLPYDVRFDVLGNMWVSDCGNNRVLRYAPPFSNGMNANIALGQTTLAAATSGTAQNQLSCPEGLTLDSSGNLWVTDWYNNRVLRFGGTFSMGMNANLVLGQTSFTTSTAGNSASGLYGPFYLTTDSSGNVWVADSFNSRVVAFAPPFTNGMSATTIVGWPSFTGSGAYQAWFNYVTALAFDSSGNLWVTDAGNEALLRFPAPISSGEGPNLVIGQGQNTLTSPTGIAVDSSGNLWASDLDNDRVLQFTPPYTNGMNANIVLGQSSFTANTFAPSQSALGGPWGVTFDASGNLWVSDDSASRVMRYTPPFASGMSSNLVLGQSTFTADAPSTSQAGLNFSTYMAFDSSGNLWVSDTDNNRILRFNAPFSTGESASLVIGQSAFTTDGTGTTQTTLNAPFGIAFDSSGNLWVSDQVNSRILRFSPPFTNGMSANLVIGQTGFTTSTNGATQSTLHYPDGISFDPRGNLWVADYGNNRVLRFAPPFSTGMAANLVLGQPGFGTSAYAAGSMGFYAPRNVAFDSAGNLWVSDRFNNRVLQFACGAECPSTSLSMSYGLQGGGSPTGGPTLTYMLNGVPHTATLNAVTTTYNVDYGSTWSVTGTLSSSSASERWVTTQPTSGVATSTLAVLLTYYHQYNVRLGFNVTGGGTGYGSPGVTYSQFGSQIISSAGSTNWVDAGSTYTYQNPLQGSSSTERWITTANAGTVSSSAALSPTYYHQYAFTAPYSVSGGGSPSPPVLTASSFGSTLTATLSSSPQSLWLDAGASFSLTNPLGGSGATERWYTASATGKVASAVSSLVYFHQYLVSAGYSVVGGGSPSAPTLNSTALGASTSIALSSSSSQAWLDAGATYSIKNPLGSSTSTERWQTGAATAGTISSSTTLSPAYYHQFSLTVSYTIIGGGTPSAPSLSYTSAGAAAQSSLSTSQQTIWMDAGAQYSAANPLAGSTSSERWTAVSVSGSATASASLVFQYQHQFMVTFAPTDNSGTPIVPSNLTISIQGGGQQGIQGLSAWMNSGVSFTISQLTWHGVDVKPAQSPVTVSSATSVPIKALIYSATVKVTDFLGLPVSGAEVKMTLANGTTISGTTGGDGTFVAPSIPLGTYTATVSGIASSTQVKGDASKQAVANASVTFGTTSLGVVAGIVVVVALLAVFMLRRRSKGGAPVPTQAEKPAVVQPQAVKCPNCGTMVEPTDPFCPNCGAKVR